MAAAGVLVAGLTAGLATDAGAAPVAYRFDPTHSFVHFEVLHFGASTIRGRFGPLQGEVTLDRDAKSGRVQLSIDTAAVSTGLGVLDARLRQSDMLASEEHPKASFVGDTFGFDAKGKLETVKGMFTLRGESYPLTLTAVRFSCYPSPLLRRQVCGGDFTAEFRRSLYNITHSLPFVGDKVRLLIQVEAIRGEATP
jgi:polyisoprenoid-binding protein YceI